MSIIYKITNNITGKGYIGQTTQAFKKRWYFHCYEAKDKRNFNKFYNAIRKYGAECWSVEVLEEVNDVNLLNEREVYWINYYNTFKNGYNSTSGGERGSVSVKCKEETKKKISKANKGKLIKEKNPMYGKIGELNHLYKIPRTKEVKEKISKTNSGVNNGMYGKCGNLNPMFNVVSPMKGKRHTPEAIQIMKLKRKEYWEKKKNNIIFP